MTNEEKNRCLNNSQPPAGSGPTTRKTGIYLRCLGKDDVSDRFEKDTKPPEYGQRIKPWRWRWDQEVDGLSVSCLKCCKEARCAILLNTHSDRYLHAVEINLEELQSAINVQFDAHYAYVPENPCHYVIRALDVDENHIVQTIKSWQKKLNYMGNASKPKTADEQRIARAQQELYNKVFTLHSNLNSPHQP